MKTPSDSLFNLIKSLSKGEKQYFKKFSSIHTGKENHYYMRLYDEIEKQTENGVYDEEKIKKTFAGEKFVKQLHVTKNYLFNAILRSLKVQRSNVNYRNTVLDIIGSIVELENRVGL